MIGQIPQRPNNIWSSDRSFISNSRNKQPLHDRDLKQGRSEEQWKEEEKIISHGINLDEKKKI